MSIQFSPSQDILKKRTTDLSVSISDLIIETVLDRAFITDFFEINTLDHSHPYYELHISLHEEYKICFDGGQSLFMHPPMVCLIPPKTIHHTERCSEASQSLALRFTYRHMNKDTPLRPIYDDFHRAVSSCAAPAAKSSLPIFQLVGALRRETLTGRTGSDILEGLLLAELYINLLRILMPIPCTQSQKMPAADNLNTRYIKIEAFYEDHLHEQITQKDLADSLFLSTRQIARILKTIYGLSFHEKLTEMRLNRAAALITETELSLETISEMVGYDSYTGFYLAFRKKYGISVSAFRKRLRNQT